MAEAGPSKLPAGKQHTCTYEGCGKTYTKPAKLAQHIRSHTGERPFACSEPGCNASYMRNEHLKAHQRQHLDPKDRPFQCTWDTCDLAFWTSSQLKNHVQACHTDDADLALDNNQRDYPCTETGCGETFHKRKNLRLHVRQDHSGYASESQDLESSTATPFACTHPGCSLRFTTNAKRKAHLKIHQPNRYTCAMEHKEPRDINTNSDAASDDQIYTFPTWSALQAHIKAAHPRACSWPGCNMQFARQDSFRAHYKRHEARKLRLELELRTIEMSQESQLNYRRAGLTDDSDTSSDEDADFRPNSTARGEASSRANPSSPHLLSSPNLNLPSEEELIRQAAQLSSKRPRRGGIFRDLHSSSQSIASTTSASDDGHTSRRSGTTATGITAADVSLPITCSWNGCPKTYSSKKALSVHVRSAHLGEKPFECVECGKCFAHKHLVTRHRRICKGSSQSPQETSRLRYSTIAGHEDMVDQPDRDLPATETDEAAMPSQQNVIRTRLLDLLTGSGYSSTNLSESSLKRAAAFDDSTSLPKKRVTRDRVFDCPWDSIQSKLSSDSNIDPHVQHDETIQEVSTAPVPTASCDFRFKRIYDLRRHLQAHHGLALEDREIKAWFEWQATAPASI